jgi:hypothetical protein
MTLGPRPVLRPWFFCPDSAAEGLRSPPPQFRPTLPGANPERSWTKRQQERIIENQGQIICYSASWLARYIAILIYG